MAVIGKGLRVPFRIGRGRTVEGRQLTPLGLDMIGALPPVLRESPDYIAVMHVLSKEVERAAERIEAVRRQFNPAKADLLLGVWERITRQTVEPVGVSVAERQAAVTTRLRKMLSLGEGISWQEQVDLLVGPGWSYEENIPGDTSSPAPGTLRITLPFEPGSSQSAAVRAELPTMTPAHLEIEYADEQGFLLDKSEMDADELTI